jgi:methyl coenzyme M reductase subunit C-like uncharacterized protein (methanogenesis marker protein 7)
MKKLIVLVLVIAGLQVSAQKSITVRDTSVVQDPILIHSYGVISNLVKVIEDEINKQVFAGTEIKNYYAIKAFMDRESQSIQKFVSDLTVITVKDSLTLENEYAEIQEQIQRIEKDPNAINLAENVKYKELLIKRKKLFNQVNELGKIKIENLLQF